MPEQVPSLLIFVRAFVLSLPALSQQNANNATRDSSSQRVQRYRLCLYERRSASDDLDDHLLVGSVRFALSDLVAIASKVEMPILPTPTAPNTPTNRPGFAAGTGPVPLPAGSPTLIGGTDGASGTGNSQPMVRVSLRALRVNDQLYTERRRIVLKLSIPVSRRKGMPYSLVAQVVDIARADDTSGRSSPGKLTWLPLYRSESLREPTTDDGLLHFEGAILPEWRLGAIDTSIRIRILLYDARARCLRVAASCVTSLTQLQEMDPLSDVLALTTPEGAARGAASGAVPVVSSKLSGPGASATHNSSPVSSSSAAATPDQLGYFELRNAEPASFGGVFSLQAVYHSAHQMTSVFAGSSQPHSGGNGVGASSPAMLRNLAAQTHLEDSRESLDYVAASTCSSDGVGSAGGVGLTPPRGLIATAAGVSFPVSAGMRCPDREPRNGDWWSGRGGEGGRAASQRFDDARSRSGRLVSQRSDGDGGSGGLDAWGDTSADEATPGLTRFARSASAARRGAAAGDSGRIRPIPVRTASGGAERSNAACGSLHRQSIGILRGPRAAGTGRGAVTGGGAGAGAEAGAEVGAGAAADGVAVSRRRAAGERATAPRQHSAPGTRPVDAQRASASGALLGRADTDSDRRTGSARRSMPSDPPPRDTDDWLARRFETSVSPVPRRRGLLRLVGRQRHSRAQAC